MLTCQKDKFVMPEGVTYLNCATKALMLKAVEEAGIASVKNMAQNVFKIKPDDFFTGSQPVRQLFSTLIQNSDPERIAIVPSVSYAMAAVALNLHRKPGLRPGQHILLIGEEFPSDVYAWKRVSESLHLTIKTLPLPEGEHLGKTWNEHILDAISAETALVVVPPIHWMYGTRFDLEKIGQQARAVGALLVIDATQAAGAYPIDIQKIQPDMLVAVSYKWMLGVYSLGLAYFGPFFDEGVPVEETWMGRINSNIFSQLTHLQEEYRPKAFRYNVGEQSHFIMMPMLEKALEQLTAWGVENIQTYCRNLVGDPLQRLSEIGFIVEDEQWRSSHLMGIRFPQPVDVLKVQHLLSEKQIYVSARGKGIRVATHLFNDAEDLEKLISVLQQLLP